MRQVKAVTTAKVWFECDQCGYTICTLESDVPITLHVMGREYHFHGTPYPYNKPHGFSDVERTMFDHTKSCFARWVLAQSHLNKVQVEGCEPERVGHHSHRNAHD